MSDVPCLFCAMSWAKVEMDNLYLRIDKTAVHLMIQQPYKSSPLHCIFVQPRIFHNIIIIHIPE